EVAGIEALDQLAELGLHALDVLDAELTPDALLQRDGGADELALVVLEAVGRLTGEADGDRALLLEGLQGALAGLGLHGSSGATVVSAACRQPQGNRCGCCGDRDPSA